METKEREDGRDKGGKREINFDSIAKRKILKSLSTTQLFEFEECKEIEEMIDKMVREGEKGKYKHYTVDRAPLRAKYFFGEGYTYGGQLKTRGPGNERLYPHGEVDPIPSWIKRLVIQPIEDAGLIPRDWVNSAVVNDYQPGGCIVSHIDPPQLFDRPIITASFLSDSALSFGCRFSFKPIQVSDPVAQVAVARGCVLSMGPGYSADDVTHCIRPEDVTSRRAVVILRHVPDSAPRMTYKELDELRRAEEQKKNGNKHFEDERRYRRRSLSREIKKSRRRSRSPRRRTRSREKRDVFESGRRSRHQRDSLSRSRPRRVSRDRDKRRDNGRRRQYSSSSASNASECSDDANIRVVILPQSTKKPSVPGFVAKVSESNTEDKEDGEISCDDKVTQTVTDILQSTSVDKEEEAFQKRLEKLKANISNEIEGPINLKTETENVVDANQNSSKSTNKPSDDEEPETDGDHNGLKSEVRELKNELNQLKEIIAGLKSNPPEEEIELEPSDEETTDGSASDEDLSTSNAVDIISREVRTTIMSKSKTKKTTATYLKIKAERKEKLLKSKLTELKNEKRKTCTSEFKKSIKKQKYRQANSRSSKEYDSEEEDGQNILEAFKKRLKKKLKTDIRSLSREKKNANTNIYDRNKVQSEDKYKSRKDGHRSRDYQKSESFSADRHGRKAYRK